MGVPNILLTRIDNRMLHGQVFNWIKTVGANLIICADDDLSKDKVNQTIMQMTADAAGVAVRFFALQRTIDIIYKAAPTQKIFIVCRNPESVKVLIDNGVPIKEVNVGNMHFTEGKTQLSKKVYVDENDLNTLKYIGSKGVDVFIQDVPGSIKTKIE